MSSANDPTTRAVADLDPRLVAWLATQLLDDALARLLDSGADGDVKIHLADVFVDLPCARGRGPDAATGVLSQLLGTTRDRSDPSCESGRFLLVGGPGTGKSTATAMAAQLMRASWVSRFEEALPAELAEPLDEVVTGLRRASERLKQRVDEGMFPVRLNLPALALLLREVSPSNAATLVYEHIAACARVSFNARRLNLDLSADDLRECLRRVDRIAWFFDGFDELPAGPVRRAVAAMIAALIAERPPSDRVVVATRPQGYDDEFDGFEVVDLTPLDPFSAQSFCERLLSAWRRHDDEEARRVAIAEAFEREDIKTLARSPLHVAILAMFVAREEQLPNARWGLFRRYFDILFDRELRKLAAIGITSDHRPQVFELHARIGLTLHVRAQTRSAARLSTRELRALLTAYYRGGELDDAQIEEKTAQMLRFATERMVLVLRVAEGGYGFAIRSLQEFFAAAALRTCDGRDELRSRLDAIASAPHWANVLLLLASGLVMDAANEPTRRAARLLVDVCRSLNAQTRAHSQCRPGSRLAIALLRETELYGGPWIHNPLWEIALEICETPVQDGALKWVRRSDLTERGDRKAAFWDDPNEIHESLGSLAFSWRGDDRARRWEVVFERARGLLNGGRSSWHSGVRLLLSALREGELRCWEVFTSAPAVADEEALTLFSQVQRNRLHLPLGMLALIRANPRVYTPGALLRLGWIDRSEGGDAPPSIRIASLVLDLSRSEIRIELLPLSQGELSTRFNLCAPRSIEEWREVEALASHTVEFAHWGAVARFHLAPSPETLSAALTGLTDAAFAELRDCVRYFAWPLAASLRFVDAASELSSIVAALRSGELGDEEDWLLLEQAWRETSALDEHQWQRWVDSSAPWSGRADDPPFVDVGLHYRPQAASAASSGPRLSALFRAIERDGVNARRALLILRELAVYDETGERLGTSIPLRAALRLRDTSPQSVASFALSMNCFLPDLREAEAGEWIALLDERGRRFANGVVRGAPAQARGRRNLSFLIEQLSQHPDRWGLASAVLLHLIWYPDALLEGLRLPPASDELPPRAVAQWTVLSLLSSPALPADLAPSIALLHGKSEGRLFDYRGNLGEILARRTRDPERSRALLCAAIESTTEEDAAVRDTLTSALLALVRRTAPYSFETPQRWQDAGFSPPFIEPSPPEPMPSVLLSIESLTDLRIFRETPKSDVPFPTPPPGRGQWVVLIGENGTGKTTLLRALALTLAAPEVASKQLHSRLLMVRNGGPARLAFRFTTGVYRAEVHRAEGGRTEVVTSPEPPPHPRPWVVGYGVRRGNALGETGRTIDWGPEGDLHTLFDREPTLVVAQDWLLKLDRRVARERSQANAIDVRASTPAEDLWNAVVGALKTVLDVEEITAGDDDVVFVKPRGQDRVKLECLSDGYLSTMGWIVDLIARWVRKRESEGDVLMGDILGQMMGVVLVDEIDLHLHPRWQMRVFDDIRRIFPKLTFIVTTHNPLTLQSARAGEVYVLRRGDGGTIELAQRDIHTGYDVDRTLLELFGIDHTFDAETRKLLREYRKLRDEGVGDDHPRRVELVSKLRERLGTFADPALSPEASLNERGRSALQRFRSGARRDS